MFKFSFSSPILEKIFIVCVIIVTIFVIINTCFNVHSFITAIVRRSGYDDKYKTIIVTEQQILDNQATVNAKMDTILNVEIASLKERVINLEKHNAEQDKERTALRQQVMDLLTFNLNTKKNFILNNGNEVNVSAKK